MRVLLLTAVLVLSAAWAGEWAEPKEVPYQDPPPTVLWGPSRMSDLASEGWGLYGVDYNGPYDKLTAVYFWHNYFHRYRSPDSTNPASKDTIAAGTIAGQENDSFQDLAYCRYDNSYWVHSSKYKRVYKVDAAGGGVTRQFQSPATRYPTGIAFDERHKEVYLIDRMGEGQWPCSVYVTDTMGTVLRRAGLQQLPTSYAGARCLDFDYSTTNPNWPSLLLTYSFFRGANTLDSCKLYELDRNDFSIIHQQRLPNLSGQTNNVRGVGWDPRSGDYWIGIMQNPDNRVYKLDGWYALLPNDVGITGLAVPRITYNIGDTVRPRVIVRNFDTLQSRTFTATMRFTGYSETRTKTLIAQDEDTIGFPPWVAPAGGDYVARCSLHLAGDAFPANDTWAEPFRVIGTDVACTHFNLPAQADVGDTITPTCSTYNNGTTTVSYSVRLQIGSFYDQLGMVMGHTPGTARLVTFPQDWVVGPGHVGVHVAACSTRLAADIRHDNDKRSDTVEVAMPYDVGVTRILAPVGRLDSGATVTPACTVDNWGTVAATYDVRMRIGSGYEEVTTVTGQPAGTRWAVTFPPVTLRGRGTQAVTCSTEYVLDMWNSNDKRSDSVFVAVRDIGITRIIAPVDTVPAWSEVSPRCVVRNFGNSPEPAVPVRFQIGTWADVETVFGLGAGDSALVTMGQSYYTMPGVWLDRAELLLSDPTPANNIALDTFWVLGPVAHDVGASAVLAPSGSFDTSTVVTPRGVVTNHGEGVETFWTLFRCVNTATGTTEYLDSVQVSGLEPGVFDTVDFTAARFPVLGPYSARCSTWLSGDQNSTNDLATGEFTATWQLADVGVTAIYSPGGMLDTMTVVEPRARWRNFGSIPCSWRASLFLVNPAGMRVYSEHFDIEGAAGADTIITFPSHSVGTDTGLWTVRCSTYSGGDPNPANDVTQQRFNVAAGMAWPEGWVEVEPMPLEPSGKAVKEGGWAALMAASRLIFVAKGNKTADLYAYDPVANHWSGRAAIPTGIENKLPKKGAAAVADGSQFVYFTKGNNTVGFWRYDAEFDSFTQLPDVPYGMSNKKVKGGTDMVYVDEGDSQYVYLLKGYKNEFYRFNVVTGTWQALPNAPAGANVKWDKGSWLVHDGGNRLYAHKAKHHEFYTFDMAARAWDAERLTGMPLPSRHSGKSKKSKDGGTGAYFDDGIWALKGGNTQDWYRYDVATDAWEEHDALPAIGTTGKKKRVKAGSDLVSWGNGAFFTAKGNKTVEFWRYYRTPGGLAAGPGDELPVRGGVQAEARDRAADCRLQFLRNPAVGRATIRWSGLSLSPAPRPATLSLYDASGRLVYRRLIDNRHSSLDIPLPPGIYLVRLSGGAELTRKLVVE